MEERERLERIAQRVATMGPFEAGQRVWWLELRQAVEDYLRRCGRDEHQHLRAAYRGVQDMPERLPNEGARWHELREAVAATLQSDG